MQTTVYPPSVHADARNRAWRTLVQGLAVDVAAAVVLAVLPSLSGAGFAWTREYWLAVAGLAGRSAIVAAVSYVARRIKAPQP